MTNKLPPIYFYLPQENWPKTIPKKAEQFISESAFGAWIIQTYLHLKEAGFPCEMVNTIPDEGILIAYRYSLPYNMKPNSKLLWVCIKGDQNPHPYAQLQIVQNAWEVTAPPMQIQSMSEDRYLLMGQRHHIPLWPQPGLIPRHPEGGDRFENIAYYGISHNLARELFNSKWQDELENLGFNWVVEQQPEKWHDYSKVDAIVAARSFAGENDYSWKPASKLFNCWRAGVPAILGRESAFQYERKSELDYIEVNSFEEAIAALQRLRDDQKLRQAMVENGKNRTQEIETSKLLERWCQFLTEVAVPAYEKWCSTTKSTQQEFIWQRYIAVKVHSIRRKILLGESQTSINVQLDTKDIMREFGQENGDNWQIKPEKQQQLSADLKEIAKILYSKAKSEDLQNLERIEKVLQSQSFRNIVSQPRFF